MLGEVEYDERGLAHDKTSDMAAVLMRGADGRLALLAFTSTETLARWNPEARPVPVVAKLAAQSAVQEDAAALVVDIAGPTTFVVEGDDVRAGSRISAGPGGGPHGLVGGPMTFAENSASSTRWTTEPFLEELRAWIESSVGRVRTLEQAKLRAWAGVWRVTTVDGVFYAKQNTDGRAFEAALVAELAALAPGHVVPVAAVDRERGLLLTVDRGTVFAETVADDDPDARIRLVTRAMELAGIVAPAMPVLVTAGLSEAPGHPSVAAEIEQVDALGLPISISHNDLHGHNAFDTPGGLRFFDFADSVAANPLSGLLVPLNEIAYFLGEPPPDDARLRRVADAALEVWSDVVPIDELRAALPAALRLGRLGRAESRRRAGGNTRAAGPGRIRQPPPGVDRHAARSVARALLRIGGGPE
ncbi:SseB family protein [Nocardioides sp. B-3]|uniref:SseB family protein n=1 Tax=Nocardioides sp. B-3 TaxID=2895565 RepID=UPI0021538079|nr:SseB family protein [Nocardioides sp. B-3]UUZ58981.1 SseB family protein [Nocardioides sp. B-3]